MPEHVNECQITTVLLIKWMEAILLTTNQDKNALGMLWE